MNASDVRDRLQDERRQVAEQVESLRASLARSLEDEIEEDGSDSHPGDSATATFNREVEVTLEAPSSTSSAQIDGALERVEAGTYGICTECGRQIAPGPTRGMPYTDGSVDSARRIRAAGPDHAERLASRAPDADVPASRPLGAGAGQWTGIVAVAAAAFAADQLTQAASRDSIALNERSTSSPAVAVARAQPGDRVRRLRGQPPSWRPSRSAPWSGCSGSSRARARATRSCPVALGLLLGGSVANLYDRLVRGYVTDFIDLPWWATFNFADTFIVAGVALLMVGLFRAEPARSRTRERHRHHGPGHAWRRRGSTASWPIAATSARGARPSGCCAPEPCSWTASPPPARAGWWAVRSCATSPPAPASLPAAVDIGVQVPCEDDHLLVVEKPAGLVTHPASGVRGTTLVHALLDRGIAGGDDPERPGVVHRLDRDTTGLLVFAAIPRRTRRSQPHSARV